MKDDLPYFSHDNDSRNHPKMKALRARYGWTGYGQFWALNEMIAGSAEARLDLSRKVVRSATACELGMTTDALDDFLFFLSNEEECGLINYENGVVTTDRTQEDFDRVVANRLRKRNFLKNGAPELENGAPESENGAPESYRIEENRGEEKEEKIPHDQKGVYKAEKHKYGSFQNVLLTDDEKRRLVEDFHSLADMAIQYLSEYKVEKKYTSHSDNLTIRRWVIDAVRKKEGLPPIPKTKPAAQQRARKCPECGGEMIGGACSVCFNNFDEKGNKI